MTSPAFFTERHCARCRRMKPVEEFRSNGYCTACKSAYNAERNEALKAGKWKPKKVAERAPPLSYRGKPTAAGVAAGLPERPEPPAAKVVVPFGADAALQAAMSAFMREHGFGALHATLARIESELARSKRAELFREGWIG
jgi:hypothetical protein